MGRVRRSKGGKYSGMKLYKETSQAADIVIPSAGNVSLLKLSANFMDVTNAIPPLATVGTRDSFRSLYSRYCIMGIKYRFIPMFTSSDSGTNPAARVAYAISRDPNGLVTSELDVLRQNDAKFTDTTKGFTIYIKNPEPVLYSTAGLANQPTNFVVPSIANQVAASDSTSKWKWLPTRLNTQAGAVHPDHVGADMVITANTALANDTKVYTVYKTVYLAFKEQD